MSILPTMRRKILFSSVFSIIIILIVGVMGAMLYIYKEAPKTIYNTDQQTDLKNPGFEYEQVFLENSRKQKVGMWFKKQAVDNTGREMQKKSGENTIILYLHGNIGRIPLFVNGLSLFADVLSPTYPGYGESEGKPSPDLVEETADIALDYLINVKKYPKNQIIIWGHSLGGAPTMYLSSQHKDLKGTVIVNTFNSTQSICWNQYSALCMSLHFVHNSETYALKVKGKIRQYHVQNDTVVPTEKGEALYGKIASTDKKFEYLEGTHSGFSFAKTLEGVL